MDSLLFGQKKPKPIVKTEDQAKSEEQPQLAKIKGSPMFAKSVPASLNQEEDEGEDGSGGGHQAAPATETLNSILPSPDRATPSLFANGKSATSVPSNPNLARKLRSNSAGGLTPRQFFGENRQAAKNKASQPTQNLANPNSPRNKTNPNAPMNKNGPRLGKR